MPEETTVANEALDSTTNAQPEAEQSQTPEGAQPSIEQNKGKEAIEQVPFHEHPRFKSLIEEKNQLKAQLAEIHSKMAGESEKRESPIDRVVKKYVSAGMTESAARVLAEGQFELGRNAADERVAPIERASLEQQNEMLFSRFAESHKDYEEVRPKMGEMYASLSDQAKAWVSSNPEGLQYLYDKVKSTNLDAEIQKAFNKGVQEGYKRKQDKTAIAPSSGGVANLPKGTFSEDDISKMSLEDYKKNQKAILASRGMK